MAKNSLTILLIVGIVAVALGLVNIPGLSIGEGVATEPAEQPTQGALGFSSLTWNFDAVNREKPATATSVSSAYFLEGSLKGNQSVSSLTVAPNTNHKALIGYAEAVATAGYYPVVAEFKTGLATDTMRILQPQSGAMTGTFVNSNGIDKNAAGTAEAYGAAETNEVELCLDVPSNKFYGADGAMNVVCAETDATDWTHVKIPELSTTGTPTVFAFTNTSYDEVDCWEFPQIVDGVKQCYAVELKSLGNPAGATGHPVFQIYDASIDIDADSNELIFGVEDESNTALSNNPANVTFYIS